MKQIPLTKDKFAIIDEGDYDFLMQWKWHYDSCGYARRYQSFVGDRKEKRLRKCILMHRLIVKTPDGFDTDHINGNRLDNRHFNLRVADRSQNLANTNKQPHNTSGIKGVFWHKRIKKWQVSIGYKGEQFHLGYFLSKEKAAEEYKKAAHKYYGEFARCA